MCKFLENSITWVVDFRCDGHLRRWFKLLRPGHDTCALMAAQLHARYGERAQLVDVRMVGRHGRAFLAVPAAALAYGTVCAIDR